MSTNNGVEPSQVCYLKRESNAKPPPIRAAPIHPDLLVAQAACSENQVERKSYMTKEWKIPERPKPGRKPKEKQAQNTNLPKNMDSKAAFGSSSQEKIDAHPQHGTKWNDVCSSTPKAGPNPADSLQQKYIDLLEQKVEALQKEQSREVNHYRTLAAELGSKVESFSSENGALRSQLEVLRSEVIRLRKKISLTSRKGDASQANKPIAEAGRVRKELTEASEERPTEGEVSASKKARKRTMQIVLPSLKSPDHQVAIAPAQHAKLLTSRTFNTQEAARPLFIKTGASHFSSMDNGCGLCTSEIDCVCSQVGLRTMPKPVDVSEENLSRSLSVPIRPRLQDGMESRAHLWNLTSQEDVPQTVHSDSLAAVAIDQDAKRDCSGNPSDCAACCDDAFGKAFCTAISNSSLAQRPVASSTGIMAPRIALSDPIVDAYTSIPCCGEPQLCGSNACFDREQREPMISCSEAWRQLKVHPNIGNANLQLLADVVARQSLSTKAFGLGPDLDEPESSLRSNSSSSIDTSGIIRDKRNASDWTGGPHGTLAAVFENVSQSKSGVGTGSGNHSAGSTPPSESEGGNGNRLVKFVARRSLQEALVMLDGAGP